MEHPVEDINPIIFICLIFGLVVAAVVSSWADQFRKIARKRRRRKRHAGNRHNPSRGRVPRGRPDSVTAQVPDSSHPGTSAAPAISGTQRRREQRAAAYGEAGEKELLGILRHGLDPNQYEVLSDIMLPDGRGATTQIDFIVVSEFGIFVIEAKNYAGWIFAGQNQKDKAWIQTLQGGVRNTIPNPIRQNWAHICALESATGIPKTVMFPVVAFSDRGEFKSDIPDGVCYFSEVIPAIQSKTEPLVKAEQIPDIADAILAWDKTITPDQRAAHVANLRARHAKRRSGSSRT